MMKHFVYLEDVAVADIAFDAFGTTLNELFSHCAEAVFSIMVNLHTVSATVQREIHLRADTVEHLLYDFLSELIYLKDTELLLLKAFDIHISEGKQCTLQATAKGETIDQTKHELGNDVKAITLHQFAITKEKNYYKARVVVDI